jgi:protein-L-isoaspartate(D-aspartate) O-methyltransferase
LVVSVEIDPVTYAYAKHNLEAAGYQDIVLVLGDGGSGCPEWAPYDRICLTAACGSVPAPLWDQLKVGGKLIAPVIKGEAQYLALHEKRAEGIKKTVLCEVLYVSLRGRYGVRGD